MALFLSRISSKLSACRVSKTARFFSSLPESPYLLLSSVKVGEPSESGKTVKHKLFDSRTERTMKSSEKTHPKEIDGEVLVGASQGWVVCVSKKDTSLHLTDVFKPWVSSPKVISLPALEFYPRLALKEVALSSSSPDEDDCVVATKFDRSYLSVCRPNCDSTWTHFETTFPLLQASDLMYSKRDEAFYFASDKGLYMGSLNLTNNKKIKYQQLSFCNLPMIPDSEWEMLETCFMTKHFVESPSGEFFFVKWYRGCLHKENIDKEVESVHIETRRFMVFREDEESRGLSYTEDIGDLCIFLSKGEAFCLSASMFPGLRPNSIYYIGAGIGCYHIGSGTVHTYNPRGTPKATIAPFWIHPTDPICSLLDSSISA
ncbi:PREDICTED: uncharacterized protein LOC104761063 [Camelina sativa]|uniref:Uncharacterized protein LOC104761063 n=1 Tax=Camelina sativa TaxID=90675 RepID=A0ABM0X8S5_CAMSA|nr:PREDICTED: uncharacterized protein LOC104761063 [Camelina sativa]XP_010482386.1 PREDICTED: uncharacterized protein LOC104761063 [Camelina sativa]